MPDSIPAKCELMDVIYTYWSPRTRISIHFSMLPILSKLIMTSGTFFPVYVTDLLTTSNLVSISMCANYLKIDRKLSRHLTGTYLVITYR